MHGSFYSYVIAPYCLKCQSQIITESESISSLFQGAERLWKSSILIKRLVHT